MRFPVEERASGREGSRGMPRVGNKPPGKVSDSSKGREVRRDDTVHVTVGRPGTIKDIMLSGCDMSGKESSRGQVGALPACPGAQTRPCSSWWRERLYDDNMLSTERDDG